MYLALLFRVHISLNKAITAQKTHCTSWIAFIDQAHVKTHVNSSYYFGFLSTQNRRKELKALMLTQLGPVGALCRNLSTEMWNVFIVRKKNIQKASFQNKTDDQGRLIEKTSESWFSKEDKLRSFLSHRKDWDAINGKKEFFFRNEFQDYL